MAFRVERGKIRELATALRATDPALRGASGVDGRPLVAPPTFPSAAMNHWGLSTGEILEQLGCEVTRVLHGEEEFDYPHGPLREGDEVRGEIRLADDQRKTGRAGVEMRFLYFEAELRRTTGELAVTLRRTLIEQLP